MRHILVSSPVKVTPTIEVTLQAFVRHLIDRAKRFNADGPGIRQGARIDRAVSEAKHVAELDEQDWQALRDEAEEPEKGYPELEERAPDGALVRTIPLGRQCLPHLDAIAGATTAPPVAQKDQAHAEDHHHPRTS